MFWFKWGNRWINMERVRFIEFKETDGGTGAYIVFDTVYPTTDADDGDVLWIEPGPDADNLWNWLFNKAPSWQ